MQRCARKHGFERSSISCRLECVDTEAENTKDRVMRLSWLLARVHDSPEHNSLGHTWWPGWRPLPETNTEKLPPEPRRQHRTDHGLGVFQYSCESLRAPDRLHELMALAKAREQPLHVYKVRCLMASVSGPITGTIFFTQPQWTE